MSKWQPNTSQARLTQATVSLRLFYSITALILLCTSANGFAEIYKHVDENGRITYTDSPPVNTKSDAVDLPIINSQPAINARAPYRTAQPKKKGRDTLRISLASPKDDARIMPAQKSLRLSAQVSSRLSKRMRIQFYLDGKPLGQASSSKQYTLPLTLKNRGKHTAQAKVVDARNGQVIAASQSSTFWVVR